MKLLKLSSEANLIVPDVGVSVLPSLAFLSPQEERKFKDSINPTKMQNLVLFINFKLVQLESNWELEPYINWSTSHDTWSPIRHTVHNAKSFTVKSWVYTTSNSCLANRTITTYNELNNYFTLNIIILSYLRINGV